MCSLVWCDSIIEIDFRSLLIKHQRKTSSSDDQQLLEKMWERENFNGTDLKHGMHPVTNRTNEALTDRLPAFNSWMPTTRTA